MAAPSPTYSPKTVPAQGAAGDAVAPSSLSTSEIPSQTPLALSNPPKRPPFDRLGSSEDHAHRASVQFLPHVRGSRGDASRSRSRMAVRESGQRRLSSPPPPTQFKPRVSFDTFDNRDASDFSLTLNRKHREYEYTKRSRTFLCGTDQNDYSDTALEWLIDELVDDGDEVVCLRVVEKDSKEAREWAGTPVGTKEIKEKAYKEEAQRMITRIEEKNTEDKAINLVLEFSIGKVPDTIQHMIRIYEPAILVVGTRGRSLGGFQGLLPGSVSKYCLQHSPVPVIVVRPSSKRDKKKKKRLLDPARRGYRDILDKSDDVLSGEGGHLLDSRNRLTLAPGDGVGALAELEKRDAEEEARMVAEAIGYRAYHTSDGGPLSRITSARSDVSGRSGRSGRSSSFGSYRSDSPENMRSPVGKLMKSPDLRAIDSPAESTEGESDEDEDRKVPAYMLAQEEALQKARERALKAEEEEKEAREGKPSKPPEPRAGVLDILSALDDGWDSGDKPAKTTPSKGTRKPKKGGNMAGGYPIP
ncbi:hypothetical protein MBLNU459_g1847t1 [Dothideomycetes sp. NU459]